MLWLVALVAGQVVVFDEGVQKGPATRFNCSGAGVTCTVSGGTATIAVSGGGGGGAPTDAKYITQTCNVDLTNEQCMSALGTGLVLNTTTTGVQSIYAGTTCTNQFPRSLNASGAATCAAVSLTADVTGTLAQSNGGTGAGALTCSAGQALTSNGTAQSCTSTLTASDVACSGTCIADAEIAAVAGGKVSGAVATCTALATNPTPCGASNWVNDIAADGTLSCAQPAFTNISGSVAAAQLPNPGASSLGGVRSIICGGTDKLSAIGTDGIPVCSADVSGGSGSSPFIRILGSL